MHPGQRNKADSRNDRLRNQRPPTDRLDRVNCVLSLPLAERRAYVERLGKLRPRAKHVGRVVGDELNDLWRAADFDEPLE
jgi:hypothetical protein